jgi:hypothetical protein
VLPVFSSAASQRSYAARRRFRIAACARRAVVGLVSSAEVSNRISLSRYHARRDVTRSRGVVLGPLAGSYRSRVRDVVPLDGRR